MSNNLLFENGDELNIEHLFKYTNIQMNGE